jgi:hypothetical protein
MCEYANGRVAEQKAEEAAAAKKAAAAAKKKAAKKVEDVPAAKKKAQEAAPTRMRYGADRLAVILARLCGISVVYKHSFWAVLGIDGIRIVSIIGGLVVWLWSAFSQLSPPGHTRTYTNKPKQSSKQTDRTNKHKTNQTKQTKQNKTPNERTKQTNPRARIGVCAQAHTRAHACARANQTPQTKHPRTTHIVTLLRPNPFLSQSRPSALVLWLIAVFYDYYYTFWSFLVISVIIIIVIIIVTVYKHVLELTITFIACSY